MSTATRYKPTAAPRFPEPSRHSGKPRADLTGCIDLHMHSIFSDGHQEPEFLVDWAAHLGLSAIALTDHDNTRGVDRAKARGEQVGVEVIPATEITVSFSGGTFHLLGYFVDHHNQDFNRRLEEQVVQRNLRNSRIVELLAENGMPITEAELKEEAGEAVVGRPHIAKLMVKHRYVREFRDAFDLWIGDGKPCYVEKENFSPKDAIELVLSAGGVPVLAHPRWLNLPSEKLEPYIEELVGYGLRGLEVIYSDHPDSLQDQLKQIAQKFDLLITGGSDYHGGTVKPEVTLGHGAGGGFHVPGELLEPLRRAAAVR